MDSHSTFWTTAYHGRCVASLKINESLSERCSHSSRLAPEFPVQKAGAPRENGVEGLGADFDIDSWKLRISTDGKEPVQLTLDGIQSLHACRWSPNCAVSRVEPDRALDWRAIIEHRRNTRVDSRYVSLETPDKAYYVGLDMPSAMHPQTLLCYEMQGRPLSLSMALHSDWRSPSNTASRTSSASARFDSRTSVPTTTGRSAAMTGMPGYKSGELSMMKRKMIWILAAVVVLTLASWAVLRNNEAAGISPKMSDTKMQDKMSGSRSDR